MPRLAVASGAVKQTANPTLGNFISEENENNKKVKIEKENVGRGGTAGMNNAEVSSCKRSG